MAKRRRLTPVAGPELGLEGPRRTERFARETEGARETKSALPPIAAMAGDISRQSAADEISGAMDRARREGRLAETLALDAIVEDHLIRDRAGIDEGEMEALIESLRARGQQVPIEVIDLGGGRYGLISGWRRLTALRRLAETGAGPGTVIAFLRRPDGDADAYLAMVEENEIRADLGFWERGRIVARAVEHGVFEDTRAALNGLFGSVPRARRSKIGSFVALVRMLDGQLAFPQALSERLGLALTQRLKTAEEADPDTLRSTLGELSAVCAGAETAEAETAAISRWLAADKKPKQSTGRAESARKVQSQVRRPVVETTLTRLESRQTLTLTGSDVNADLQARLEAWLNAGAGQSN